MVTAREIQKQTEELLAAHGIEEAKYEAKLLVESTGSLNTMQILMGESFPDDRIGKLNALLQKRITGIPLQYLLGEWEFYGLPFAVGEGVLIPRQDTETLVETAVMHLKKLPDAAYLDLCSGSGCIPIAIGSELKRKKAYAVEYSQKAYSYLKENISKNKAGYLTPMLADALDDDTVNRFADESLDCITSNPPYLNGEDMKTLQKEVRFEPEDALYALENGYLFYRLLPKLWKNKLKKGGMLAFEVGIGQAETVMQFLRENGYVNVNTADDLSGIPRVVYGYKE